MRRRHVRGRLAIAIFALIGAVGLAAAQSRAAPATCFGVAATIVGTSGNDTLLGGPGPDVMVGLGGNDGIAGGGGDDLLCGGAGGDIIFGGAGNDRIDGGDGQDGLSGDAGNDELDGGGNVGSASADFVDYERAGGSIQVDLVSQTASGADGSDRLKKIESAFGSRFADVLTGDSSANILGGEGGNDTLTGGGGQDSAWFDAPVDASLTTGRATGEGSDELVAMEGLIGSEGKDVLTGDGGPNAIAGRAGDDVISGGGGDDREFGDAGSDHIDGGSGKDSVDGGAGNDTLAGGGEPQDTVSYLSAPFDGVTVDLATHRAAGGGGSDTLEGFTNVSGSEFSDRIVGDSAPNALYGNAGNDRISGSAGADFVGGGSGANNLVGGAGPDYCLQGSGAQRCEVRGVPGLPAERAPVPPVGSSPKVFDAPTVARRVSYAMPSAVSQQLPVGERPVWRRIAERLRWLSGADLVPARVAAGARPSVEFGEPACFALRRPYRTSVAPPRRVNPSGRDGESEEAWWRGTLYRWNARARLWNQFKQTPWARGKLAGSKGITGVPIWERRNGHGLVGDFTYPVPAGRFSWRGEIYWPRTRASIFGPIEPHLVYKSSVRPAKECRFGS